jgi:hypothetical protein
MVMVVKNMNMFFCVPWLISVLLCMSTIMQWNCRGLTSRGDELSSLLTDNGYPLVFLNECRAHFTHNDYVVHSGSTRGSTRVAFGETFQYGAGEPGYRSLGAVY